MPTDTRPGPTPQFFLGVCLVLLGVLLTLDRMRLVDADVSFRFWPLALVALGTWIVAERRDTGRGFPGYALIAAGGLMLLNNFGVVRVRFWELFWPLIIVLVGTRMIMGGRLRRPAPSAAAQGTPVPPGSTADGLINMVSVLGGARRSSNDKPFRGGELTSILGGTELDLRQATIEPGEQADINVFAMLGGHEVWVPPGWTVVSEVTPVLGSVEDKRLPPIDATPRLQNGPRLVLRGMVLLGSLTIKN